MNNKYTGRSIAVLTDIHGLLEPTIAVLKDIKKRGIKEIYSLGDNIGVGPNPRQVLDLLGEYDVISIMGNSEEYSYLGIKPFISYFNGLKIQSQLWTKDQLTSKQVNNFALWPHSIDLMVGGKKLALCHFANDVRIDFNINSTWSYQDAINYSDNPNEQFYYTNSNKQKEEIKINSNNPQNLGFVSSKKDPLFNGKKVNMYDEIIQGYVHFKLLTEDEKTRFRTIRAVGMAYGMDPIDSASYVIIKEKEIGYDVLEILVPFDRNKMIESILKSDMPDKNTISKFVSYR